MEILCDGCHAKLNIPDEKIPQDQKVTITCPKCQEKLALDTRAVQSGESVPAAEKKVLSEAGEIGTQQSFGGDAALESYEEGVKLALVAVNETDQFEGLKEAIEDLGYKYVSAENTSQAISKMRFHTFEMVVLSDRFDGIELTQSPVLQYLNHLSMSIRRRIFIVLIGNSFNTMDHMTAFTMSANLVVNKKDLNKLTGILKNSISDNERFYKVFTDTLLEAGRS